MSKYRNVGPDKRDEIAPQRARHDMRRTGQKLAEGMRTPTGGVVVMFILMCFLILVPALSDLIFVIGLSLFLFIRKAQKDYVLPHKFPQHSGLIDPVELNHKGVAGPAKGTFYLGNDRTSGEEVWITNREAGVHMLVLGTTGSGKTEMLLGLCQNSLNQGSGFMFVDGKAQDKIAFKIQDLCRARGRDDDVLILNFMTGARDIIGRQPNKITHTMNPFSYGSSGMISQIVVGLMSGGGGGNDMWADRAISFVEAVSPPLCYLRDNYGLILDVNCYRQYFDLGMLEELCWKGPAQYPGIEQVLDPMINYLKNIPGYDKNKFGKKAGQGDDTKLQHGYITMQLVRAFTSLADTYGHIVRVPLGEVYFPDVVKQRRILIAMLPSLEKTPSETANIGKIIVTALRNIMAEGLGSTLEGNRDDLDNDAGRALLAPYVVILDEYGYYAVKGFAVAFAQARSLGFVCVVGGQDLASFQKESKEEAVSICGNTRLKAFGSIEDPEQTMDFAIKTGGKTLVAETTGYEGDMGTFNMKYDDQLNIALKDHNRIDPSDVKAQTEGQFHFVLGAKVIRASTYFVDPPKVKKLLLNHFVMVKPPTEAQLAEIEAQISGTGEKIATTDLSLLDAPASSEINSIVASIAEFEGMNLHEQMSAALVMVDRDRAKKSEAFKEAAISRGGHASGSVEGSEHIAGASDTFNPDDFFGVGDEVMSQPMPSSPEELVDRVVSPSFDDSEIGLAPDSVIPLSHMNVFGENKNGFGAAVFGSDNSASISEKIIGDDPAPLLDFNVTLRGIEAIEKQMGSTDEQAQASARDVMRGIEDATRYPQSTPSKKSPVEVGGLLTQLINEISDKG